MGLNIAAHLVLSRAALWPDKTAYHCLDRSKTFREISESVRKAGSLLRSEGIRPGGRVVLLLPDSLTAVTFFLATIFIGAVAVTLNTRMRRQDYAEIFARLEPDLIITWPPPDGPAEASAAGTELGIPVLSVGDDTLDDLLAGYPLAEAHPTEADDVCAYYVTSGTTGHPKIVPHTHSQHEFVARHISAHITLETDDIMLCTSKMSHVYGLAVNVLMTMHVGMTAVLDPDKPTPQEIIRLIKLHKVTYLASVPVIYGMSLLTDFQVSDLASLRACFSAGEILPSALLDAWKNKVGLDIWQGYGSTENMTFVIANLPPDYRPGTSGHATPGYELVVLDDKFQPVSSSTPGQLALKGPTILTGYLNAPEWSDRLFSPDGFLLTGDMAVEHDGAFTILGRMDDMFKVGGIWVSPGRVENALLKHPAVAQCAVTGGHIGVFSMTRAHIVLKPGFSASAKLEEQIKETALADLPDFMVPAEIIFKDSLPLTALGKVQRYKLRQELAQTTSNQGE